MNLEILTDIPFASARVGWNGGAGPLCEMALKLDAYLPTRAARKPQPALVLAFGGAFHRGSKENDAFTDGHGTSTAVAEYCRRFAALGVPSFSVQYRLAQTDPEPGTPLLTEPDRVPMSRINPVRIEMGLPPVTARAMAGVMEAAFDDVANAVGFIKANAATYGVDPARIVLGGFSAGGRCAMYAAFGKRIDVAGVVSLSGPLLPADAEAFLARGGHFPPLLKIWGARDLDYVCAFVPELQRHFLNAHAPAEWVELDGATHFYAAETHAKDGRTVFGMIRDSLDKWVGPLA